MNIKRRIGYLAAMVISVASSHALPAQQTPCFSVGIDSRAWATLNIGIDYPLKSETLNLAANISIPVLLWLKDGDVDSFQLSVGVRGAYHALAELAARVDYQAMLTASFQLNPSVASPLSARILGSNPPGL